MLPRLLNTIRRQLNRRKPPPPTPIAAEPTQSHYRTTSAPSLASHVFTFAFTAEPLPTQDLLRYAVAAGTVTVTLNTQHPAAPYLLNGSDPAEIPNPTAFMCAALVALEIEAPNTKRQRLYQQAREDLGRLLRHLRPISST